MTARAETLRREIQKAGAERVGAALDAALIERAGAFLGGLAAYRAHRYRRPASRIPVLWREGTTRLLDYGRGHGAPVLVVPSLINRFYVLDLLREHSFLRYLAAQGLRPLVVDWDAPGRDERGFGLDDYIAGRLARALAAAQSAAGAPVALLGYCMGGLLALAVAARSAAEIIPCIALLATPWDFHAERPEQARLLSGLVEGMVAAGGDAPLAVDPIQSLFWTLDPLLAERKFVRFGGLDPDGAAARGFVALEDWINDGVPLARAVARECARDWYADNLPGRGKWRVAGTPIVPQRIDRPALVVVPSRDRIVPPRSAVPLAAALPRATVIRPALGHIGMMAGADAASAVWQPIAQWLRAHLVRG